MHSHTYAHVYVLNICMLQAFLKARTNGFIIVKKSAISVKYELMWIAGNIDHRHFERTELVYLLCL